MSVTFLGQTVALSGVFAQQGKLLPSFELCDKDLSDFGLDRFESKKVIINIFPSIDTPVCANSCRAFNTLAEKMENTAVLCVSADLPFALARFVDTDGLENITVASFFRHSNFANDMGVLIKEGALRGLASRAVLVVNEFGKVIHAQLVSEITEEPDYDSVLNVVQGEN
ncbi:thiol peroxidase [Vibrio ostreicida]|uniref:Thiol peroxidase n=1 Tax=Vibrio ostreicida TaxID=526588 RepID=A0ABT8BZF8_9VIBR|nr:thiol peroxidase [Vibrio ostreicida]MDN3612084.1 thiol peroxidase [Vibrio ostreicida]NPD08747.1 thiol peroxidase [Vibrio ostreicida]